MRQDGKSFLAGRGKIGRRADSALHDKRPLLCGHDLGGANLFHGAVDDCLKLTRVFDFAAFGQGFLGSSGLNQVGFRIVSDGFSWCSTSSKNALITYSRTPGGFQKTPLEWM